MFFIVECSFEKNRKYFFTQDDKEFVTNYGKISVEEIKKKGYGSKFNLGKKEYIILKPTLSDYIMYGLKRKTQIIYPFDAIQIAGFLGLQEGDMVLESGIGSGALSLIMLNYNVKLFSFEKRQEFIDLAKFNIGKWVEFSGLQFFHKILNFDIVNSMIPEKFYKFFDKGVLDIRYPENAKKNVVNMLKDGAVLVIWVPTANQVIQVIKSYQEDFFVVEIVQIRQNQWIRLAERFRPEDWQVGERGFIIKLIKMKKG